MTLDIKYDKVFITSQASFYKIRLWNEVAKKCHIFVIFTQISDSTRNKDFYTGEIQFEHAFIPGNMILQTIKLAGWCKKNRASEIVYGGWDRLPSIVLAMLTSKKHNSTIVESSIFESKVTGLQLILKKMFMRRMSKAYVPGESNALLAYTLGMNKKDIIKTGGCGILNYVSQPKFSPKKIIKNFLFVGRLLPVKNLSLLIKVFNSLPELRLTIVGYGQLKDELRNLAHENIFFAGAISNEMLHEVYQQHDAFILPSKSETWGLVVEEALNNGLPVIVSDHVGCGADLATKETGIIFENDNEASLKAAILKLTEVSYYNQLRYNVSRLDFLERANNQVKAFTTPS